MGYHHCQSQLLLYIFQVSIKEDLNVNDIVFPIDVPYWKKRSITYHQENETYFTAVLQLGDMFDGGGVPIDHYIIQVDNNTQLETTDLTYSVDVMYNDTLFVNISAHNCAGYSDIISLTLEYDPGRESILNLLLSYIIMMNTQILESLILQLLLQIL